LAAASQQIPAGWEREVHPVANLAWLSETEPLLSLGRASTSIPQQRNRAHAKPLRTAGLQ